MKNLIKLFVLSAVLTTTAFAQVSQVSTGPNSPIINGSGNVVTPSSTRPSINKGRSATDKTEVASTVAAPTSTPTAVKLDDKDELILENKFLTARLAGVTAKDSNDAFDKAKGDVVAVIQALQTKYNATFDQNTGTFTANPKTTEKK